MESVFHRALAWVRAIPPRVVIAAKLVFALFAIVIVGTTVDWRTVATHLNGLFLPILAGMLVMVPVLMVTAWRWKLIIGTETPRRFGFLTALRGCGCRSIHQPGRARPGWGGRGASPLRKRSRPNQISARPYGCVH